MCAVYCAVFLHQIAPNCAIFCSFSCFRLPIKAKDLVFYILKTKSFRVVGVTGFEPMTPCSQSRCANRTALHPVQTSIWTNACAKIGFFLRATKCARGFFIRNGWL